MLREVHHGPITGRSGALGAGRWHEKRKATQADSSGNDTGKR